MAAKTKKAAMGEFLLQDIPVHCRVSAKVTNGEAGATTADSDWRLQPLKLNGSTWEFALAADVTTGGAGKVDGFLVNYSEKDVLPAISAAAATEYEVLIIEKGPFTIHDDFIPATDVYGSAITKADFITEVERIGGSVRDTVGTSEQQTT